MNDPIPNPGSDAAMKLGCKCPVLENARGRGSMWGGFVISEACPIHKMGLPARHEFPVEPTEKTGGDE